MSLFDSNIMVALKKSLDAGALRQRVIANNIANVNTPGFKKSVVSFEECLKAALAGLSGVALKTSDARHIPSASSLAGLRPQAVKVNDTTMRSDGNNVDIDQEMVQLAVNTINYDFAAQALSGKYNSLGYVITGGRS